MKKTKVPAELVHAEAEPGYGALVDAFHKNFAQGREIGAGCTVYRDGKLVAEMWGGYEDLRTRRPWSKKTTLPLFSTSKGVAATTLAIAHSRGWLDFDATVASYWPEFAAGGKGDVTVRQLLAHQAGLSAIDEPIDVELIGDRDRFSRVLAKQAPAWNPGDRHGYHGITLGWYESELLRHVDPGGRGLGSFFADEVAAPLDLTFKFGLGPEDHQNRAMIHGWTPAQLPLHVHEMPPAFVAAFLNPRSLTAKSFGNPAVLGVIDNYNRDDVLALEIPAASGTGRVTSVAHLYGELATGGSALGLTPATMDELMAPADEPRLGTRDEVLRVDTAFSLGYIRPFPRFRFGASGDQAFGTMGTGGSFGFADPETGIGFAYAMNRSGFHLWDDPREQSLRNALFHHVLGERPQVADGKKGAATPSPLVRL